MKPRAHFHLPSTILIDCTTRTQGLSGEVTSLSINNLNPHHARQRHVSIDVLLAQGDHADKPSRFHLLPWKLSKPYIHMFWNLTIMRGTFDPPAGTFPAWRQFASITVITTLTLADITFSSLPDLRRIISSFLALDTLRIRYISWTESDPSYHVPTSYPPCKVRPFRIYVAANRTWLNDSRSAYLVEWIGNSIWKVTHP